MAFLKKLAYFNTIKFIVFNQNTNEMKNQIVYCRALFFASVSVIAGSCAVSTNSKSVSVDVDKISQDGFVMAKPIVADLKVEIRKIQGTATVKNSDYATAPAQAELDAKSLAILDAVKKVMQM